MRLDRQGEKPILLKAEDYRGHDSDFEGLRWIVVGCGLGGSAVLIASGIAYWAGWAL